jgi:uncharacterized membrane protein YagU involved in acid resistance
MKMNWDHAILWGFAATAMLTTLLSGGRGLGFTRMDPPFMLGSMFTPNRDKARWIGFVLHFINGWIFALIYIALFLHSTVQHWLFGMFIGLFHALFVLVVVAPLLPAIHPRMADEQHGPDPTRQLEPPGFLSLNYGKQTPIAVILSHMVFGAMLGAYYW